MIQIKLFGASSITKVENEVNNWLKELTKEVISIKMSNDGPYYTILITYKN